MKLSAGELAKWLGVETSALLRWRGWGRGPKYEEHGATAYYEEADVLLWAARVRWDKGGFKDGIPLNWTETLAQRIQEKLGQGGEVKVTMTEPLTEELPPVPVPVDPYRDDPMRESRKDGGRGNWKYRQSWKEEVVRERLSGMSVKEIAKKWGLEADKSEIYRILKEAGYRMEKRLVKVGEP